MIVGTLAVLVVLGAVGFALQDKIAELLPQPAPSANTPILIDDDPDHAFYAASDGAGKARTCNATAVVEQHRCCPFVRGQVWSCDIKVVVISVASMPFISRNIKLAWELGKPSVLHKQSDVNNAKYNQTCARDRGPKWTPTYVNGSCDEYPFSSSLQGGAGARTEEVHPKEQQCQGGTVNRAYINQGINEGDEYLVLIALTGVIPDQPWAGQEYKDTTCSI